jgi:UDP-glucose 4-epimerase
MADTSSAPVLVTGGLGSIGSWVVRRLAQEGRPFVVYGRRASFALLPELEGKITFVQGDILDRERLADVVRQTGARRIIHLAALVVPACEADPSRGYQVNLLGALNLFDIARDLGLERVVFGSSKGAYGAIVGEHGPPTFKPLTEEYAGVIQNVYGSTKRALEESARHYRRLWDLDLIALRFGSTYGPGKLAHHGGPGLTSRIVELGFLGEPFIVPTPDYTDDMVYNADVAKAVLLACFAPRPEHWQFNISSQTLVSLREFSGEVMRHCPNHRLTIDESGAPSDRFGSNVLLDNTRARQELGYVPDYPGPSGVADYVEHLRRFGIRSPRGD